MQRLALGLSLALALIGTVRLVSHSAGAQPCGGSNCHVQSSLPAKGDSDAKTDLAKGDDAKTDLAKGDEAKDDLGGRL